MTKLVKLTGIEWFDEDRITTEVWINPENICHIQEIDQWRYDQLALTLRSRDRSPPDPFLCLGGSVITYSMIASPLSQIFVKESPSELEKLLL